VFCRLTGRLDLDLDLPNWNCPCMRRQLNRRTRRLPHAFLSR
jgi:hypothetical protein